MILCRWKIVCDGI